MTRARPAASTIEILDRYCARYRSLFADVRHFEQFTALHLGLLTLSERKSLPRIASVTNTDPQALHHFLSNAQWSVEALRARRLELLREALGDAPFIMCVEDTGSRKKGCATDYAARQFVSNLRTQEQSIVTVDAYGVLGATLFPLLSRVYKPQDRLKPNDVYASKAQIAIALVREVPRLGFACRGILTDSSYGQSGQFIAVLHALGLGYALTIRADAGAWMLPGQSTHVTRWSPFDPSNATCGEQRSIRELIFGSRRMVRCYEIASDRERVPPETTWRLLTNQQGSVEEAVGSTFGLRSALEYRHKQVKDALGWGDFRLTDVVAIERWWEVVLSAYTLVSLQSLPLSAHDSPIARAVSDSAMESGPLELIRRQFQAVYPGGHDS